VLGRQVSEHLAKCRYVIVHCVIRQLHSRDHDAHIWIAPFYLINDLLKVVLDLIEREATEGVVDSEFQNEDIDSVFEMGWEPLQAAFGGAAGGARIDNLKVQAGGAQLLRKQSWIGLAAAEHEAV